MLNYPTPKKIEETFTEFGQNRVDEYFWMRNLDDDSDIKELLNQENAIAKEYMKDVDPLKEKIFEEMKSRELEEYETCPYKQGGYLYFEKFEAGKEYAIHCRKKIGSETVEVCLDENELAKGLEYFSLGVFDLSSDHKILAYSTDTDGSENYTLRFKNLETGEDYPDEISMTTPSIAWFKDTYAVAYTLQNDKQRPYKALVHKLGDNNDRLLFEEECGEYFISVSETMDHKYMTILSNGSITSEYYYLKGDDPDSEVKLFSKRMDAVEYYLEHKEDHWYIVVNDEHENSRVAKTASEKTDVSNWETYIAGDDHKYINDFACFKDFFVYQYKENGLNKMEVIKNNGEKELISFPENAYYAGAGYNAEYETDTFRYDYLSMTTPLTTYDYNVNSKSSTKVYQKEVPGFNPELYSVERVEVPSHDGKMIPMSILYKKTTKLDGSAPTLLYGYGSYSMCIEPWFNQKVFSLVDRGLVYAIGHIRGSATLGRKWYEDGKFLKKKNTFLDFKSCAEFLADNNYTSRGNISIHGGSAGGMLVGATLNMSEPGIFKSVIAEVPFVDVLNTMLDSSLPLTELEYDEWGNPNNEEYYNYIKSYSPYDNLEQRDYPSVLAMAGLNDPRVTYWEPMKWIYRMRDKATDSNPKLLHTNMEAGHAGVSGRFEYLKEDAFVYSFILKEFGITKYLKSRAILRRL